MPRAYVIQRVITYETAIRSQRVHGADGRVDEREQKGAHA
jgi:hypothetical protein